MFSLGELVGIAEDGYDIAPVIPQMVRMGMVLVTTMTKKENRSLFGV